MGDTEHGLHVVYAQFEERLRSEKRSPIQSRDFSTRQDAAGPEPELIPTLDRMVIELAGTDPAKAMRFALLASEWRAE